MLPNRREFPVEGSGAALAEPPADLGAKRDEAEAAAAAGEGGEGQESGATGAEGGEGAAAEHEGEAPGAGEQAVPALAIAGGGQLNLTVGGEKPDKSTVKLRGGSIEVAGGGQLKKGEVVNLLVKVRVDEVHFVDKHDNSTGDVIQAERRHIAKMIGVEKVE
jgi:hypothetical protein